MFYIIKGYINNNCFDRNFGPFFGSKANTLSRKVLRGSQKCNLLLPNRTSCNNENPLRQSFPMLYTAATYDY